MKPSCENTIPSYERITFHNFSSTELRIDPSQRIYSGCECSVRDVFFATVRHPHIPMRIKLLSDLPHLHRAHISSIWTSINSYLKHRMEKERIFSLILFTVSNLQKPIRKRFDCRATHQILGVPVGPPQRIPVRYRPRRPRVFTHHWSATIQQWWIPAPVNFLALFYHAYGKQKC